SAQLRAVYANRPQVEKQFYVGLAPGIGNPVFVHERSYKEIRFPDPGYQLLGLYRIWNIVQYWFPYRDVLGEDWNGVLANFIPRIAMAKDQASFKLQMMALIAHIHDTHANLWSGLAVRPPAGECRLPVIMRYVEGQPVVAGFALPEAEKETGLKL